MITAIEKEKLAFIDETNDTINDLVEVDEDDNGE
jgi:hypothetical protein